MELNVVENINLVSKFLNLDSKLNNTETRRALGCGRLPNNNPQNEDPSPCYITKKTLIFRKS